MDPQPPPPPPPTQQPQLPTTQTCWSKIVSKPPTQNPPENPPPKILEKCTSTKGVALAVVDANAIIQGGERLSSLADKFVSLDEVLREIRDPTSRHRLSVFPFTVDTMEPSPDSLKKVINFARATGDLQTLSDVDLRLIALTYTLEAQFHGTNHIRDSPPPIHVLNVRRLPEKDLPGWGDNVTNLEEWEALEGAVDGVTNSNSRILPLKDLNLNTLAEDRATLLDGSVGDGSEGHVVEHNDADQIYRKPKKYLPKKREVKTEGKRVADGIDASQGQCDDADADDWRPAVSRSTRRRFLRRQARREMSEASLKDDDEQDGSKTDEGNVESDGHGSAEMQLSQDLQEEKNNDGEVKGSEKISSILEQMKLEEDALEADDKQDGLSNSHAGVEPANTNFNDVQTVGDKHNSEVDSEALDQLENGSVDTSYAEDDESEQSWMLRSLSDSSVACVTGDFAMQNVILQMGLRLLAPGGMQIRELQRWVLKCHACQHVTSEVGRVFCPKCGNGGTLRKVAVTVGENGVVLAARKPRISLRGTKFSLPLPQGGRDAMSKNPVLREDQIPKKYLYPKSKKKSNKDDEDGFFLTSSIFTHHTDKKAPHRPPVRQALAVFSGKRNPNDNHYSRVKH